MKSSLLQFQRAIVLKLAFRAFAFLWLVGAAMATPSLAQTYWLGYDNGFYTAGMVVGTYTDYVPAAAASATTAAATGMLGSRLRGRFVFNWFLRSFRRGGGNLFLLWSLFRVASEPTRQGKPSLSNECARAAPRKRARGSRCTEE